MAPKALKNFQVKETSLNFTQAMHVVPYYSLQKIQKDTKDPPGPPNICKHKKVYNWSLSKNVFFRDKNVRLTFSFQLPLGAQLRTQCNVHCSMVCSEHHTQRRTGQNTFSSWAQVADLVSFCLSLIYLSCSHDKCSATIYQRTEGFCY